MRKHQVPSVLILLTLSCGVLRAGQDSQQDRTKNCNEQANQQQLTGDARKTFISSCLKTDERTKPSEMSQKDKRKKCNDVADKRSLKGDDRKAFMATCLSTSASTR